MFIVTKITPKIKQILTKIAGFYPQQPQSFLLAKAKWESKKRFLAPTITGWISAAALSCLLLFPCCFPLSLLSCPYRLNHIRVPPEIGLLKLL